MLLATGPILCANGAAQEPGRAGNPGQTHSELELALSEARASNNSAAVANVFDRMGTFDDDAGHFAEAESHFEDSLQIWRERLGPEHLALIRVINRLAAVYLETGQLDKAERLDLAQWRERLEASEPLSDDLLPLLQNVASLDSLRGRFAEALNRFQEALNLVERRRRYGSAEHAATLNNLGLACLRAKQNDSAIEHLSLSVALWEKLRGPGALNVGLTAYNLGLAYEAAGRPGEAVSQMQRALAISEKSSGPASLRTATILQSYAELLSKLHRKAEAKKISARADRIFHAQAHQEPARQVVDVTELSLRPR